MRLADSRLGGLVHADKDDSGASVYRLVRSAGGDAGAARACTLAWRLLRSSRPLSHAGRAALVPAPRVCTASLAAAKVKLRIHHSSVLFRCRPQWVCFYSAEQNDTGWCARQGCSGALGLWGRKAIPAGSRAWCA